jgi:hypothetical protein
LIACYPFARLAVENASTIRRYDEKEPIVFTKCHSSQATDGMVGRSPPARRRISHSCSANRRAEGLCVIRHRDPANVPAFSCERQGEAEGRPAALVSCNALLGG